MARCTLPPGGFSLCTSRTQPLAPSGPNPQPHPVQYHVPSRRLVLQSAPHHPLCVGRCTHFGAHPSFLAYDSNTSRAHIRRNGAETRHPPSLPSHVNMLKRVAHPLQRFAHPLASARTSAGTRTRAACSGARILLRLQVGASGPPGPWLRLWVWAQGPPSHPGPPSHRHSQLWLSELRHPSRPDEPPGHSALAGHQVGHSGLAGQRPSGASH